MSRTGEKVNIPIFIAVFFSCMMGAKLFGVSINKIALIPLELYLLKKIIIDRRNICLDRNQRLLIFWFFLIIIASLFGLLNAQHLNGYEQFLIYNIAQSAFIYIPIILGISTIKQPYLNFKHSILIAAKINCIWGIMQFFMWYIMKIDLNQIFFTDILKGIFGMEWTKWIFESGSLAIRITGLNHDPAFYAIFMILGFCFCNKIQWKILFFGTCLLAMSRTGAVAILVVILVQIYHYFRHSKISLKPNHKKTAFAVIFLTLLLVLYTQVNAISYQLEYFISRVQTIGETSNTGTNRHVMYPILAWLTWFEATPLAKLIGIGPRVSGAVFAYSDTVKGLIELSSGMLVNTWAVECDIAEILLGSGIIGFITYYALLFKVYKKYKKIDIKCSYFVIGLAAYGVMYNIAFSTIISIFLILTLSERIQSKVHSRIDFQNRLDSRELMTIIQASQ